MQYITGQQEGGCGLLDYLGLNDGMGMSKNKRREQLAVYKVIKAKGLKPRFKAYRKRYSGEIICQCNKTGKELRMIWDGAGYDEDSKLVLIEAELTHDLVVSHIHSHLSRVVCMQGANIEASCLAWVVFPSQIQNIKGIVEDWLHFFTSVSSVQFPMIEYWDDKGTQYH